MKIDLTSVLVDDQEKALAFYTDILGFTKKTDMPMGAHKWLTVVSSDEPGATELLLEPNVNPAAQVYQKALFEQNIPATSFGVEDMEAEYERLSGLGVRFPVTPKTEAWGSYAIFDDTCGNLISLHQQK